MKTLAIIATLLISGTAFAGTTGASILFQADSVYVNAAYNKSLCFDGVNFRATYTKCVATDNSGDDAGRCISSIKVNGVQPANSTRTVPVLGGRDGEDVVGYKTVSFNQSPSRKVKVTREESDGSTSVVRSYTLNIPSCAD